jgi:uncharacterized protein (DUF362 family)
MQSLITRRKFIDQTIRGTAGAIAASACCGRFADSSASPAALSRVVTVRDDQAVDKNVINAAVAQIMMNAGIMGLTGIDDVGEAWRSLFPGITASSVIGIKINCLFSSMATHPKATATVVEGLKQMIVDGNPFPENNIIVWDRSDYDLTKCGYTINTGGTGVRCFGTNSSYTSQSYSISGASKQSISRILTDRCAFLVNLCVLKNHGISGVSLSLKNHLGTCSDPGGMHDNYCNPSLTSLNSLSAIRDKQVVAICDAFLGTISGGPDHSPQVALKSLIFSRDPVAMDYVGAQMLKANGCSTTSLTGASRHIATAGQSPYNLGTSDPAQMEQILIENPSLSTHAPRDSKNLLADGFEIDPNHPNPFNSDTVLSYSLARSERVRIEVWNSHGGKVCTLFDGERAPGRHAHVWNGNSETGSPVSSGIYLAVFQIGSTRRTLRMDLLR